MLVLPGVQQMCEYNQVQKVHFYPTNAIKVFSLVAKRHTGIVLDKSVG